jgi:hypothetical protein
MFAQVEPREVGVGRRAIASVGHLITGSPRTRSRLPLRCLDRDERKPDRRGRYGDEAHGRSTSTVAGVVRTGKGRVGIAAPTGGVGA